MRHLRRFGGHPWLRFSTHTLILLFLWPGCVLLCSPLQTRTSQPSQPLQCMVCDNAITRPPEEPRWIEQGGRRLSKQYAFRPSRPWLICALTCRTAWQQHAVRRFCFANGSLCMKQVSLKRCGAYALFAGGGHTLAELLCQALLQETSVFRVGQVPRAAFV